MAAGVVEAERDQVEHALLAHVLQVHRRAGWVLGGHYGAKLSWLDSSFQKSSIPATNAL